MASLLTSKEHRVIDRLVKIAGGERAFEDAVCTLRNRLHRPPTAKEVLVYLLQREVERLRKLVDETVAEH
jgi:hypothetical protein